MPGNLSQSLCVDHTVFPYVISQFITQGIIPGGEAIVMSPPEGPTSYDWTANVYNGTSIMFLMFDSQGRNGGSSDVRTVSTSDDTSCINNDSAHTTAQPTSTGTAPTSTSSSDSTGTPIGAIAGTVIGGLIFLAVVVTLSLFFLKKRNEKKNGWSGSGPWSFGGKRQSRMHSVVDLTDTSGSFYPPPATAVTPSTGYPYSTHRSNGSDPFRDEDGPHHESSLSGVDQSASEVSPFTQRQSVHSTTTSAAQRKAAMAGVSRYGTSRFVVHTDLEDVEPPMNDNGVVELPPQYSERRGQASTTVSSSSQLTQPPPGAGYAYPSSTKAGWQGPS
jgi:hypothetical protein